MKLKLLAVSLFFLGGTVGLSQPNTKISLEWKISPKDTLRYRTTMNSVQTEAEKRDKPDSVSNPFTKELQRFKESFADVNSSFKYQTVLFVNSRNTKHIDIETRLLNNDNVYEAGNYKDFVPPSKKAASKDPMNNKSKKSDGGKNTSDSIDFKKLIKGYASMSKNVILRGRISTTGELISTYYNNAQRNLISLLFELPNRAVEVGEQWKLNVNLVSMDQNFTCDSVSRENSVYIEKIIESGNDRVAVIRYNLREYVTGDFSNSMMGMLGNKSDDKTFMGVTHIATGYFSLGKGKWNSYEGVSEIVSNFPMMNGSSRTEFKLVE